MKNTLYKSLQGSRAVAALLVLFYHIGGAIASDRYFGLSAFSLPFSFGHAGVEFFFILSGFIILSAHRNDIGQPKRLSSYLSKRFLRIFPGYWIIFLAVFCTAMLSAALRDKVPHDPVVLIKSLLLIPQGEQVSGVIAAPVLAVAWTLQYEVVFYLLFASAIVGRRLAILCGLLLASIYILKLIGLEPSGILFSWLAQDYVLLFAFGMFVAKVHHSEKLPEAPSEWCVVFGVLLFLVIAGFDVASASLPRETILYGVASGLIVFGLVRAEDHGRTLMGGRLLQKIGDASYALYLIHFPIISLFFKLMIFFGIYKLSFAAALLTYLMMIGICVGASITFHKQIEQPIAAFFKKRRATLNVRGDRAVSI